VVDLREDRRVLLLLGGEKQQSVAEEKVLDPRGHGGIHAVGVDLAPDAGQEQLFQAECGHVHEVVLPRVPKRRRL